MQAFHNDKKIKEKYVKRVMNHQKADRIIQGNSQHCAVGCTLDGNYNHKQYEIELGIPEWLARLEDRLFEGMPKKEALLWPAKFLKAITPGQDLEKVKIPFLIFIVESARENFDHKKSPKQLAAIDGVLIELKKDVIDVEALRKARAAAAAAYAAAYAAYAASAAAAADAAAAAADADAAAAAYAASAYAADAAAASAASAAAAAKKKEYKKFANKLLELIKECK